MVPDEPGYFERLYARDPDPWRFATSAYEREKYAATLDALPPGRRVRGFEVGCSIGVLTRQLAARCDALVAVDVAEAALAQARVRCADQPWVTFERMAVPEGWPEGQFDLMVFSEVLYYLHAERLEATAVRVGQSLGAGGVVVLVNWLGETGAEWSGDAAAEMFIAALLRVAGRSAGLRVRGAVRQAEYRLDVLG